MIQIERDNFDKIMGTRDGSVELFFDDEGIVQQIIYRNKRRRREGESIQVLSIRNGTAIANYDNDGNLQKITYETVWKRKKSLT